MAVLAEFQEDMAAAFICCARVSVPVSCEGEYVAPCEQVDQLLQIRAECTFDLLNDCASLDIDWNQC